jgi:hypothetical protein
MAHPGTTPERDDMSRSIKRKPAVQKIWEAVCIRTLLWVADPVLRVKPDTSVKLTYFPGARARCYLELKYLSFLLFFNPCFRIQEGSWRILTES